GGGQSGVGSPVPQGNGSERLAGSAGRGPTRPPRRFHPPSASATAIPPRARPGSGTIRLPPGRKAGQPRFSPDRSVPLPASTQRESGSPQSAGNGGERPQATLPVPGSFGGAGAWPRHHDSNRAPGRA